MEANLEGKSGREPQTARADCSPPVPGVLRPWLALSIIEARQAERIARADGDLHKVAGLRGWTAALEAAQKFIAECEAPAENMDYPAPRQDNDSRKSRDARE